ncbi:ATP-binding protein [Aurantibacillus circumpalustris]|uniref:ATP-binding protein n=1 Tax=Aurantibacillus circumpalustris TaxID=3036359 RepID=UPI00295BEF47|nr:ATP-binding protein [Aurantibacillus circumpalustris]
MEIQRVQLNELLKNLKPQKVTLLLGARRVGKSILIETLLQDYKRPYLYLNGEDEDTHLLLAQRTVSNYTRVLNGNDLLVIDEAQGIPEIGKKLKLMVDSIKGLKVLVTGSSSFDILNISGEPLTGRSITINLYPIWQGELKENALQIKQNLEDRLIYGSYPELWHLKTKDEKQHYLNDLANSYLLKDILILDGLRNASVVFSLLKMIAYQIGKEVSYNELGNSLGISKNTVEKYLNLLTKVFVLYKVSAYSNNLRKEISKSQRWYFIDNGIRNAVVGDFQPLALRREDDKGMLWENYLFMERLKRNTYKKSNPDYYFWRTYDQQEIDLLEVKTKKIQAFEFKYSSKKTPKVPIAFAKAYPTATFQVVNDKSYLDFIL